MIRNIIWKENPLNTPRISDMPQVSSNYGQNSMISKNKFSWRFNFLTFFHKGLIFIKHRFYRFLTFCQEKKFINRFKPKQKKNDNL